MKLVAVIGSPRKKGDCYSAIKALEEALNRRQSTTIDYVYLDDLALDYCKSCFLCMRKTETLCPHKAVTLPLYEKMQQADAVILASPVYEHQITGMMKNFYDHFGFLFHRPCFQSKPVILISSTGSTGLNETLSYMRMAAIGWGFKECFTLGIIGPAFQRNQVYQEKVKRSIAQLAAHVERSIDADYQPSPSLYRLIFFRMMRVKISSFEKNFPSDYEYWQSRNWFQTAYFTNGPIRWWRLLLANAVERIIRIGYGKQELVAKTH